MRLHKKLLLPALTALIAVAGCSTHIKQFYPDSFFGEDCIYQNKPLGLLLTFQKNWSIETDPNEMERAVQKVVRELQSQGAEILFVGSTTDGMQGVRGVAANLNLSARQYAQNYKTANADAVSSDSGLADMIIGGKEMVRWVYTKFDFRFIEFFFTLDTYNLRIAFWAKPDTFERFLPVYFSVMATLEYAGGF